MARLLAQAGGRAVNAAGADCAVQSPRENEPWYLWPCNVPTWNLWSRLQTQWRVGMAGATGLDYAGVWALLDGLGYGRRRAQKYFSQFQAMERAVLKVWDEKRNSNKD